MRIIWRRSVPGRALASSSIFIPNGYSALLTEDGRGLLTPEGYVLAIIDGSLVFVPLAEREASFV